MPFSCASAAIWSRTASRARSVRFLSRHDILQQDPEMKVHICTIQGLVKRVLYAQDE